MSGDGGRASNTAVVRPTGSCSLGRPINRTPEKRLIRVIVLALALAVYVSPLVAAAQGGKVWRIGLLGGIPEAGRWTPLFEALRKLGYVEGQNLAIEMRSARGKAELFPEFAAELVRLKVDVIVAGDNPAIAAAQKATRTIPIVMVLAQDPVASGFAHSLARPGGNLTGLTVQGTDLQGKTLQILKEAIPTVSRVAVLWVPTEHGREVQAKEAEAAARALGLHVQLVGIRRPAELDSAFAAMARDKVDAVRVQPSQITFAERVRIAELAVKHRIPSMGPVAWYVESGGLLGYGPKDSDRFERAGHYVAKILAGATPANLPIEQATTFELKINLKTAKALGLTIPPSLLLQADRVVE